MKTPPVIIFMTSQYIELSGDQSTCFVILSVLVLGAYVLNSASNPGATPLTGKFWVSHPLLTLIVITAVAGPGAGLAWLLSTRERKMGGPGNTPEK
ncbi:hypothetical protein F4809DRAFT_606970 [Biscogniauxia mediterranea]|nr:hypothetical protein F4809DRAFT_606970 [Biscogniauxia mediterranea]